MFHTMEYLSKYLLLVSKFTYDSPIYDIHYQKFKFKLFLRNSPWEMTQSDVVSREIYVKLAILKILHVTDIPRVKS